MIYAAVIWHWWIAPLLTIGGIGLIFAVIFGYYKKVAAIKYPPKPKIPAEEQQG